MAVYKLYLTAYARQDLEEIYHYLYKHTNFVRANHDLEQIYKTANSIKTYPKTISVPRELDRLGMRAYRQIYFKPYRIIYQIINKQIIIFLISDGRQDMQTLLSQRLIK